MPADLALAARVVQKRLEAEGVVSLTLAPAPGVSFPPYDAGAHIDVDPGSGIVRQYSLCSAVRDGSSYEIAVLREAASRGGSSSLHDLVQVGQWIGISEPRNHFPLNLKDESFLLLAGGIGVTPILAMAESLADAGRAFTLHYCGRSAERMAYVDRLSRLSQAGAINFHVDDGPAEQQLDLELAMRAAGQNTGLYVCGPGGFIEAVMTAATRVGWAPALLHKEFFSAPAAPDDGIGNQPFVVHLARSGRDVAVAAEETLADALDRAGVFVPVSCMEGICGACILPVLEGVPDHRDAVFSDEERAANDKITVCCSRARGDRLVLDI